MTNPKLALIPSGYKATKVYSILPSDGGGNFTFDRTSEGTRVRKDGLIEEVSDDVPRLDWSNSNCPSLLLEPQSTNLITYSEDFSEWSPTNIVLTEDTIIAPDGTTTADKIVGNSVTAQHRVNFTTTNVSGATTFSFFAKSGEYTSCWARIGFSNAYFDLENGVAAVGAGITSSIENFGNGWYRCIMTKASSSANEVCRINITTSYLDTSDFLGDNTSGIYLWGAQVEEGNYPTSYIKTEGSTATRLADVCNNAGNSDLFNDAEGVLYAEIKALADDGTNRLLSINNSTASNAIWLYFNTSNNVTYSVRVGGVTQASSTHTIDIKSFNKIAIKYKENDFALWINGTEVATDTSGSTYPSGTLNNISFDAGDGALDFYGKVKDLRYYNTALTDAELTELTT